MDTTFSTEDTKFQLEVRTFIEENYPKSLRESVNTKRKNGEELTRNDLTAWHKVLGAHNGWSAPGWPAKFGGAEFTPTQKYIFEQECARAECQYIIPFGINMCAPVIYTFGNEEQKAQHLPGILSGETFWCQGYSEPGSGSDLASLKTAAVKEGDHYIVNGQKTWTTLAQHADWIFCLVRTNPEAAKPQEGISFLLIDMKTPGISIRPIYLMDGTNEVNEVWFDNVKVPAENLIGTENQGWTYAKFLLAHERSGIAGVARSKKAIERVKQIAASEMSYGEPLIQDPAFIRKIADAELELTALEYTELRTLAKDSAGKGPGAESSILKIKGTEIQQGLTEIFVEAAGEYALMYPGPHGYGSNDKPSGPQHAAESLSSFLNMRKTSIYGGSNEIQKNIISKFVLGV